ncbi:MAG: hypothetical protein ACRDYC_03350, partial [Acidimicrobiales bacterium]
MNMTATAALDRVEVVPGPGVVIRFGSVAIWVGPQASPDLLKFLGESARNLAESPTAGEEIANHLAEVLGRADPEPGVPFATLGRGPSGWAALLHGPVQLWDGRLWMAPTPQQPWLRTAAAPSPMATVAPAGTLSHQLVSNPAFQLEAGTVPGGGFTLLPATHDLSVVGAGLVQDAAAAAAETPETPKESGPGHAESSLTPESTPESTPEGTPSPPGDVLPLPSAAPEPTVAPASQLPPPSAPPVPRVG